MREKSGKSNQVVDVLSRRDLLLKKKQIEVVGLKELKNLYPKDLDFGKARKACIEPNTLERTNWLDFIIHDGMFF